MSVILEEGIGFGGTDKDYPSPNSPTDKIISHYESLMSRSIAAKTLTAARTGESPQFTKEEMAYLVKKTTAEQEDSEVKVITPSPTITIKKGKTEINVKRAAELVQRMEQSYPKGMNKDQVENIQRQPFIAASIEHGLKEEGFVAPNPIVPQHETKTVNKNAYEIRLEVLKSSAAFLQWNAEMRKSPNLATVDNVPTADDVLSVAQMFYKFVEQRR